LPSSASSTHSPRANSGNQHLGAHPLRNFGKAYSQESNAAENEMNQPSCVADVLPQRKIAQGKHAVVPLAAAVALGLSSVASAATITVNNSTALSVAGSCTIVDAVASINQGSLVVTSNCANSGAAFGSNDTINFLSNFTISFVTPAGSSASALLLSKPATITGHTDGNGKPLVTIERSSTLGTSNFRLIETSANLTLSGVTVRNGNLNGHGAGIYVTAVGKTLTLTNSVISGNSAINGPLTGRDGGGVYIGDGTLTVTNSTISGNYTPYNGGGIYAYGSTATIAASTISGNNVGGSGGGIYARTLNATNATISGNYAMVNGGGISSFAITLNFCTVAGNSIPAFGFGGGVDVIASAGTATATATLMYNNQPDDIDGEVGGRTLNGDHNLIGIAGANISVPGDTKACDPNLGPLFDNGGPTNTYPLFSGSCALNAGPTTTPDSQDQRGLARSIGAATDIGAFEKQGTSDPPDLIFVNGFDP
jgi:hypothetical protein